MSLTPVIEYENLEKFNKPFIKDFNEVYNAFIKSGRYILGGQVSAFENEFAAYCKVKHCIGVANGLDALTISLKCFEFEKGSEVLVQSNTYIATILSIVNS
ncbi:MAG: DegT/DnrJ/EryC1/StrS family aminotransferase, partial [Ginsengibacter sp.]